MDTVFRLLLCYGSRFVPWAWRWGRFTSEGFHMLAPAAPPAARAPRARGKTYGKWLTDHVTRMLRDTHTIRKLSFQQETSPLAMATVDRASVLAVKAPSNVISPHCTRVHIPRLRMHRRPRYTNMRMPTLMHLHALGLHTKSPSGIDDDHDGSLFEESMMLLGQSTVPQLRLDLDLRRGWHAASFRSRARR